MICPRCKSNIPEESLVCPTCSLKVRTICPKCKQPNILGQEFCSKCHLRLLRFCPQCKAANAPGAKNCRKCNADLVNEPPAQKVQQPELIMRVPKSVLVAELINWKEIQSKFPEGDFSKKLLAKFYQIFAKQAQLNKIKAKKLETTILGLVWNEKNLYTSATIAAAAALNLLSDIKAFNAALFQKIGISLEIRLFLCSNDEIKTEENTVRRLFSKPDEITVSKTLCYMLKELFELDSSQFEIENQTYCNIILKDLKKEPDEAPKPVEQPKPAEAVKPVAAAEPKAKIEQAVEQVAQEPVETQAAQAPARAKLLKEQPSYTREEIFNRINEALMSEQPYVVGIAGDEGIGKTTLLNSLNANNQDKNFVWMWGQCSANVQVTPLGLFRDILKNLFDLPVFITDNKKAEKLLYEMLSKNLQILDKNLIKNVISLTTSSESALFENILKNKDNTITTIIDFLEVFVSKTKLVLVIDDIDFIDGFSFEILNHIVNSKIFNQNFKIILTFQRDKKVGNFLISEKISDENAQTYELPLISADEIEQTLTKFLNNQDILPPQLKQQVIEKSHGLPLYVEETVLYLMQKEYIFMKNNVLKTSDDIGAAVLPGNLRDLIADRVNDLKANSKEIYKIVSMTSLLGPIFMPSMVKELSGMSDNEFGKILEEIGYNGIFKPFNNYNFVFKNFLLWEAVYKDAQEQEETPKTNEKILKLLKKQSEFDGSIKALKAEAVNSLEEAVEMWSQAYREAIFLGDTNLFTIAQRQLLKLFEKVNVQNKEELKFKIYENLGKLNYEIGPAESIQYLSNAIVAAQDKKSIVKVVDLSGYLAKSCMLINNFTGAIECTDKAISFVNKDSFPLEYALLSYTKLKPLFELGNLEETVNTAQNEVIPAMNNVLNGKLKQNIMNLQEIEAILIKSELILAKSLAIQGKDVYLQITNSLLAKAKQINDKNLEAQCMLVNAFYKTIQGNCKEVIAISNSIKENIPEGDIQKNTMLLWNFINVLNSLLNGDTKDIKDDMFMLATFAENNNEESLKNIIKTLLGKVLVSENACERALIIYNQQIEYFSKSKMAIGAMLTWYLIAELEIFKSDFDNGLQIAEKAFEVSKNVKINNYLFMSLFKQLIAEAYLLKGDYTAAKMHVEEGLVFARQFGLFMIQVNLGLILAQAYQESASKDPDKKSATQKIANAHANYMQSLNVAQSIDNDFLIEKVEKELQSLSTLCQLLNIKI